MEEAEHLQELPKNNAKKERAKKRYPLHRNHAQYPQFHQQGMSLHRRRQQHDEIIRHSGKHLTGVWTSKSSKFLERVKDPRLKGSDDYVARLGWRKVKEALPGPAHFEANDASTSLSKEVTVASPSKDPNVKPLMGSLHDEISNVGKVQSATEIAKELTVHDSICQSRPCYHCISYMHSVGIERMFWTDGHGGWESAKVGDLVDNLQILGSDYGDGIHSERLFLSSSLYVMKHELLFLKRSSG